MNDEERRKLIADVAHMDEVTWGVEWSGERDAEPYVHDGRGHIVFHASDETELEVLEEVAMARCAVPFLRRELEAVMRERDELYVRGLRADAAESENARLRGALERIAEDGHPHEDWAQEQARAALARRGEAGRIEPRTASPHSTVYVSVDARGYLHATLCSNLTAYGVEQSAYDLRRSEARPKPACATCGGSRQVGLGDKNEAIMPCPACNGEAFADAMHGKPACAATKEGA